MRKTALKTELEYFEEQRAHFYSMAPEKFVLIKDRDQHGFYGSEEDALEAGASKFGMVPFLIKKVVLQDPVEDMTTFFLGLIHASF